MNAYREVYERDYTDEQNSLFELRLLAQRNYEAALLAEKKRRQPRAKVRFKDLPKDVVTEIRDRFLNGPLVAEINRLDAEVKAEKERRERLLNLMAPTVEMKPEDCMHRVKTTTSLSYGSQGYGAQAYARGALEPIMDHMKRLGFVAEIRRTNFRRGTGQFAIDHADFELWVNCPPWMFDAAYRRLSLKDAVASMKARCINPLVYNPFLPDSCRL